MAEVIEATEKAKKAKKKKIPKSTLITVKKAIKDKIIAKPTTKKQTIYQLKKLKKITDQKNQLEANIKANEIYEKYKDFALGEIIKKTDKIEENSIVDESFFPISKGWQKAVSKYRREYGGEEFEKRSKASKEGANEREWALVEMLNPNLLNRTIEQIAQKALWKHLIRYKIIPYGEYMMKFSSSLSALNKAYRLFILNKIKTGNESGYHLFNSYMKIGKTKKEAQ